MGSDGFQTQRNKSWVSGQVRAERVSGGSNHTRCRKEWTCKFCSESNVLTRWRCRRCYHNILASLHRKYEQAIAAKSGDWSTGSSGEEEERKARSLEAENKDLTARIGAMGKKEGAQNGSGISFEEGHSEEVWRDCMEVEDDAECRRKLDEPRKKMQRDLREVERLSFALKEVQENLVESLQHQLQEV